MKRSILVTFLITVLCFPETSAQEHKWTLEECVAYALTNNISLQRQQLLTETAAVNLTKSKMDILPTLNFGSDLQVQNGRSVSSESNLIIFEQNISNTYSLSTSVQIFNGFTTMNTIAANKFMLMAGIESEKLTRNNLIISIMSQYYQVIYAKGLEKAAEMRLTQSERQLFRIGKMVETGKEAVAGKYEMQSQVSTDRLAYTVAVNDARQALTTFKQLLQVNPSEGFDLLYPATDSIIVTDSNYDPDSIYSVAAEVLPRLRAIEYELEATKKQVAVAKGNISPSLSAGGTIYTGYYRVSSNDSALVSFPDQLKNNNSQVVYMTLNIPLFNNYVNARNIRLAKIRKADAEFRLEEEKNVLYAEIENACFNCERGRDEYLAAKANLEYNNRSFTSVEKKFEAGLTDITDYTAARTTLYNAETEALRTKLQLLIRQLTINFYLTGEYENIIIKQ